MGGCSSESASAGFVLAPMLFAALKKAGGPGGTSYSGGGDCKFRYRQADLALLGSALPRLGLSCWVCTALAEEQGESLRTTLEQMRFSFLGI